MDRQSSDIVKSDILYALEQKQFVPYFQPLHDAQSGNCVGAEILARLPHSQTGLLYPASFLPCLESGEEHSALTKMLLEKTGKWLAGRVLPETFMLTFNITANMAGEGWLTQACRRLLDSAFSPFTLVAEITEQHPLTQDTTDWRKQLECLKESGVLIALDDFGTGCSGLYLLQQTGAGILKLPREFVSSLSSSVVAEEITDTVIELAHRLELTLIAEGVETHSQQNLLVGKGISLMQGYYYSPPLSEQLFSDYLCAHEVKVGF